MAPNVIRRDAMTLSVLALVGFFTALPGRAAADCVEAPPLPGTRYPLIDWRAANGGALPQTHTYRMREDTFEITIEAGTRENLAADEMSIVLRSGGAFMWRKEIAAVNARTGTVSSVATETFNQGPDSMRIRRGASCFTGIGTHTIVLRKKDALGWLMRDMYHFDVDHFWSTLGGKIVTFRWVNDNIGDSRSPSYLSPYVIPFDRNLAAVSWALPFNLKRVELFENRSGSLHHSWAADGGWMDENLGSRFDIIGYRQLFSSPAVSSAAFRSVDVFVRNDRNNIEHWDGIQWRGLGFYGEITSSPASVSWGVGRIDLVVRGTDFGLYHQVWNGSAWSGWYALGGWVTSAPSIVSRGFNRLDVFARGGDGALWTTSWTGSAWTNWSSLGGVITSDPAAVVYAAEKVAVFARGTDNALWTRINNGGVWSAWSSLGGVLTSAPSPTSSRADQMDVFVRGSDGQVYQRSWQGATGWSGWSSVALPICSSSHAHGGGPFPRRAADLVGGRPIGS